MVTKTSINSNDIKNYIPVQMHNELTKQFVFEIDEKLARAILKNLRVTQDGNPLYFPTYKRIVTHSLSIQRDKALLLISLLHGVSLGYSKSKLTAYVNSSPYAETQTALGLYQDLLSDSQHRKAQVLLMNYPDNQDIRHPDTLIFSLQRTNKFSIIGFEVNNLTFDSILKPTLGAVRLTQHQILLKNAIIWHGNWIVFDEWGEFDIYSNEEFSKRFTIA